MMPSAEFTVRRGDTRDMESIAAFNIRMAEETENLRLDPGVILAGVNGMIENPDRGFYLVVETRSPAGSIIVASLMVTTEWSDWRNGTFWWIQSVYVLPEYRRRGLYRMLYQQVRELAAGARDVCGFRLYVEQENSVAQSTYRSLGMEETGYRLYEELVPGIHFTLS
jgi:ribosomal protein S18 acetylase RimI-like enzyme